MNLTEEHFEALEAGRGLAPTPNHLERLARRFGPELAQWSIQQWLLRRKAAAKFAKAEQMLFTAEALEQATHERIAQWRASQFPAGCLVVDMTAGIGGDLIALAARGPAVGYELDPERAAYARHNVGVHGLEAEVLCQDSLAAELHADHILADPARRVGGRRVNALAEYLPDPRAILQSCCNVKLGAIKLSPMLADEDLKSLGPCVQFLSFGGECREALVNFGLESRAVKEAVRVESGSVLPAAAFPECTDHPETYFFDADPAAIRAHALGSFDLLSLGDHPGYLTGSRLIQSEWLKTYEVLWSGAGNIDKLKQELKHLDSKTPELKQRGTGLDLIKLRKQLKLMGRRNLVVAFWKNGRSARAAILEPICSSSQTPTPRA